MSLKNIPNKIIIFLKEVWLEMKKVNWPTKDQTLKYTFIVIGICVFVAFLLGGFDYLFTHFLISKFIIK